MRPLCVSGNLINIEKSMRCGMTFLAMTLASIIAILIPISVAVGRQQNGTRGQLPATEGGSSRDADLFIRAPWKMLALSSLLA